VLSVVERHGGSIHVDSSPGRGTTFRLSFPVSTAPRRQAEEQAAERAVSVPPKRGIRVLVVEDEHQLARMATLVLTQHGHRPAVARSGDDAMNQLEEAPFDLVISDLGLGAGMNGWDLAQVVRKRWPSTRFVLVTGWGAAIDLALAHARGVDRVIPKPYRIADLRQVADDVAAALSNE
jgi:CheY-like chemotaxis protein